MLNALPSVILVAVTAVCAYHVGEGWRTGVVRFPLSAFVDHAFERDRRPEHFWGVMIVDGAAGVLALVLAALVAWNALPLTPKAVDHLRSLDGCYKGEGAPDFMRPRFNWTFKVSNGVIFDRQGRAVSSITLHQSNADETSVSFSPGILVSVDEHKASAIYRGDVVAGKARLRGSRGEISLADEWGDLMLTTSCS